MNTEPKVSSPMTRFFQLCLMLLVAAAVGTGCGTSRSDLGMREKEKFDGKVTQYYLTFHTFETQRDSASVTLPVEYEPGRIIYIDGRPLISSRSIRQAEPITVRDGLALRFSLDGHGTNQWSQLSGTHRGSLLVLMIDGRFRSFVKVRDFSSESTFELAGPFDPEEAEGIVKYAPVNYSRGPGDKID